MTESGKSQIQTVASAVVGFVLVVGVGVLALTYRGGASSPKAPAFAARQSAAPSSAIPQRAAAEPGVSAAAVQEAFEATSPAPVMPTEMQAAAASAQAPARSLVVTEHLSATQTTSARAEVAAAPAASEERPAAQAPAKPFVAPKLVTGGGIASSVHYGVSSRSELMGRAAGPVYNFKGRAAKKTAAGSTIKGDASTHIEEARQSVEKSGLDAKSKKDLSRQFQLIQDGVGDSSN